MDIGAKGGSPGGREVAVSSILLSRWPLPVATRVLGEGRPYLNGERFSHPHFLLPPSFSFPFNSFLHLLCLSHSLSFPILLFLRKMGDFKATSECSVRLGSGENTCPNSEKLTLRKLLSSQT